MPPYPERDGGFVCNVAVALHARVTLVAGNAAGPHDPLTTAALRRAGVQADVQITTDFPVGAGLGGSSAAGVALQAALAYLAGDLPAASWLVEQSRGVEVEELGVPGGWQDHYASALGGALALDFGHTTRVERIPLRDEAAHAIARRCILVYTGETRISGANITAVLDAYAARTPRVIGALARMAALARSMADTLRSEDIDALGALVREHWECQRALHPAITTPRIDAIVARATDAGALGVKALGASGGGCVVIVAPEDVAPVHHAVAELGTVLPYTIAMDGVVAESAA